MNARLRIPRAGWLRPGGPEDRWLALLLVTRAPATGTAVLLLAVDRGTPYDGGLIALAGGVAGRCRGGPSADRRDARLA